MIKNKLSLILTLTFSSILIISVIVLAILQTNTKPDLPNPDKIVVYSRSLSSTKTYEKNSDEYDEILKLYNKAFEKTFLEQLSEDNIINSSIYEDTTTSLWNDNNKKTGVYIEFVFNKPKKYIIKRGENTRRVDITKFIFEITKNDSTSPINIYYETEASEEAKKSQSSNSSNKVDTSNLEPNYALTCYANTSDLYKYITTKD